MVRARGRSTESGFRRWLKRGPPIAGIRVARRTGRRHQGPLYIPRSPRTRVHRILRRGTLDTLYAAIAAGLPNSRKNPIFLILTGISPVLYRQNRPQSHASFSAIGTGEMVG